MSQIPTHFSDEKNKGMIVIAIGAAISLILLIHLIQFAPVIAVIAAHDLNANSWETFTRFMHHYYDAKAFVQGMKFAWTPPGAPNVFPYEGGAGQVYTIVTTLILVVVSALPVAMAAALNPYRLFDLIHGDARQGTLRDIREMEERRQVGIRGGQYLTLGQWPATKEPVRLIETLSVLVLAPPGTGKSLAPHEPVLMYDGTIKRTGDLVVGDLLMGPDSTPRRVTNTCPGYGPMFRVTPTKGKPFECNGDHILSLRCSKKPRNRSVRPKRGDICHVTVNQWLGWSREQKGKWKQWRAAVDFPATKAPAIDPYLVGLLLGDGTTTAKVGLHTADSRIAEYAYEVAARYGLQVREERQAGSASVFYAISAGNTKGLPRRGKNPLRDELVSEGLNVPCGQKAVPHHYKTGSRETRLALLAGYIDTDGSYDWRSNVFDLCSKSRQLIDDIAFIARSLGFAAYPSPTTKTCTNTGATGIYYRVVISGDLDRIPTRLGEKKATRRQQIKNVTNTGFEIEPIGNGEYFGIIVDGDHQYLLDDFTVTHNTASFVIPSILETDESSFIVNDPKPELFDQTSGWRRVIGHVFKIDWSATDKVKDDDGQLLPPDQMVFYPRFNVLSPKLLPPMGTAERDTYLDAIANVLSPGGDKGGKNDYFEQKGRAALVGFLHYFCSKVNDSGNMDGVPENWKHANEACIPMIIDMITEGLQRASDDNDRKKEEAANNNGFYQGDALSDWLKAIVAECKARNYNPRAATEITPLISMAPNERSGVLGTMDKAFLPFRNAAVRERTTSCDFVPSDLRGMVDPADGEMKPVTLYVCVNQAEAAAFATITALLYEVLSREFLAYGPGEVNRNNVKLGPYPVCFMLDEFAKLPKIESVMTGPDLGRSKKTYYCLVAQSDSQIGKIYSKEDQQIIYATTAVKYILPQNDKDTIELVQKMVGSTTIKRNSRSRNRGGDLKEWGKGSESVSFDKVDFIRPGDISSMRLGYHMLICQGFMSRPYMLKSVMFFKEPAMVERAWNPRTNLGPKAAPPMPDFIRAKRIAEVTTAFERDNLSTCEAEIISANMVAN